MEAVWRLLGNPKKYAASPAVRDLWPETEVPDGMSDQDLAVALFFYYSCSYAHFRFPIITAADLAGTRKEYLESTNRLQEEVQLLRSRWPKDPEAKALATALDAAISFYRNKTKHIFDPSPRSVARKQGDPYQRAYAIYMAGMARQLFGKSMYGTTATVTNVALVPPGKVEVSKANVEGWCKGRRRS
jgi:hypothetical protein